MCLALCIAFACFLGVDVLCMHFQFLFCDFCRQMFQATLFCMFVLVNIDNYFLFLLFVRYLFYIMKVVLNAYFDLLC